MNIRDMEKNSAKAITLLKAVANERRLQILCLLYEQESSVTDLSERLNLSQSALSQHLAWLRRDELVATRKEAQTVFYSLNSEEVKRLVHLLHDMYC
ncbi:ArsR/SmtB family transcription factor [Vibrio ulleungensis]|jgi:DNA-binding transcriptional ArsR family regulator|uniref:Winged helix-turn-helix transcriptional regulator n=1 Tax=Vibrio ulleungensis TaxID=2807619 RepID=A0ABS2HLG8_9VIBR|nr:metalloregulator ArsR/SmtB family transcription factor [Vibrio ulleungensis]MBM7038335.1 winged helix-turn-helix transcriptional regulator [Vibrio ulleungensis]